MLFYVFALISALFESTFLNHLRIFSIKPDLVLLLIAIFVFYLNFSKTRVVLFCLFCGFLKDILSIDYFGTYMVIFVCLGFALSYISKKFLRYNWVFIIPLFAAMTICKGIVYVLIQNVFFDKGLPLFIMCWRILALEILYGILLFFVFFKPIKKFIIDKLS